MRGRNWTVLTVKKAGVQPPQAIVDAIARKFPTVRLVWAKDRKRWALAEFRLGERPWLIRVLETRDGKYVRPNFANTVQHLDRISPTKLMGKFAKERFLKKLDEEEQAMLDGVDRAEQGRRHEGHDRLWRALHPRVIGRMAP